MAGWVRLPFPSANIFDGLVAMRLRGFEFPDEFYYLVEQDMWAQALGEQRFRVGITSLGVHLSGHFFLCRPKPPGTLLMQGQSFALVEINKAVMSVKSPLSGELLSTNLLLSDEPERIQHDPYGAGWIAEVRANRWAEDLKGLAFGNVLASALERRLAQENIEQVK